MAKIPVKGVPNSEETTASEEGAFDAVAAAEELAASMAEAAPESAPAHDRFAEVLEEELAAVNQLLAQREQELVEANARAERALQEVERSKERLERAAAQDLKQRRKKLLASFLDVLDDLDRAIASARDMDHNPEVMAGIELVRRSFLNKLAEHNVRHVPAAGEEFNPDLHDAITTVAVSDDSQAGKVINVISEGYAMGEETLRPARVAVGKKS